MGRVVASLGAETVTTAHREDFPGRVEEATSKAFITHIPATVPADFAGIGHHADAEGKTGKTNVQTRSIEFSMFYVENLDQFYAKSRWY
jgi:hypothetical protein